MTSRAIKISFACASASFVCLMAPLLLFAHSMGVSHEETIGEYYVDIGYDPEVLRAGERVVFDFGTLTKKTAPVDFDYVWVRLMSDEKTVFASGIARAAYGPTSLLYTVPRETQSELRVVARYQLGDDALAETTFSLPVQQYKDVSWLWWALAPFLLTCAGALLGFFISYRRGK